MLLAATFALIAAITLLAVGLRGHATDDHPLCRRCGYDLTGRAPATTRCNECGADLTRPHAIRIGHRARRRGPLAVAVLLLVPSLVLLGVTTWVQLGGVDLAPYKPVWWLRHDLDAGPALQAKALAELTARVTAGQLSAAQVAPVADCALAAQAGSAPWVPAWATFIDAAQAAGRLDPPRWATYARQGFTLALRSRPTVRAGDIVPLTIDCRTNNLTGSGFAALFDLNGLAVDGRPADQPLQRWGGFVGHRGRLSVGPVNRGVSCYTPQVDAAFTRGLAVGPHTVRGTLHLLVYEAADLPNRNGITTPPDPAKQLTTFDVPVSAPFTICDAAHEPPLTVVDPAQRAAVIAAVKVASVTVADAKHLSVDTQLERPPVAVNFRVTIRPAGGGPELPVDGTERADANQSYGYDYNAAGSLGAATHADVIFRPDLAAARNSVDATPIWGEEIIVHNVPVARPAR